MNSRSPRPVFVYRQLCTALAAILMGATGCGGNNTAPSGTVTFPVAGTIVYPGAVLVQGSVSDAETVDPTLLGVSFSAGDGSSCVATIDAAGLASCELQLVNEGETELTLTVADPEKNVGRSPPVGILVLNEAPTVTIENPGDGQAGYTTASLITFIAKVEDKDQPSGVPLQCAWTSSTCGALGTAPVDPASFRCTLSNITLCAATQQITVDVADEKGKHGTHSITLPIKGCTDSDNDGFSVDCDPRDCNDFDPTIYPGANEFCDQKDNDCNGVADDPDDADGDGFNECTNVTTGTPPGDCNDADAGVNPRIRETCDGVDNNCDREVDEGFDADGDGATSCGTDCDDGDEAVFIGAPEICDNKDNDCDGVVDEDAAITFYVDADGDGFGNQANPVESCTQPAGTASNSADCNDADATVRPTATESCNGIDDNCSGIADENTIPFTYYVDSDGDWFGNSSQETVVGCVPPAGYVITPGDCDDTQSSVSPASPEICDGRDNDCDVLVDEDVILTFYLDGDGDGFGVSGQSVTGCVAPEGYAALDGDCADSDPAVSPGAVESCDGDDDNCNGLIDDDVINETYYRDNDQDGYGSTSNSVVDCKNPEGYILRSGDCNDNNAAVNPEATESCNGLDDDCDGSFDENVQNQYWIDSDRDTFGDSGSSPALACSQPEGYVANNFDCNDDHGTVYPGASELCDGLDNNCNEVLDEGLTNITFYADTDGDGYGDVNNSIPACAAPPGYVSNSTDCKDTDATAYPGGSEVCDGVDDDCDGKTDEGTRCYDDDGDGFSEDQGDCNDANAAIGPGATEYSSPNGVDENCNGIIDEKTTCWDDDGDGYIEAAAATGCPGYPLGAYGDTIPGGGDCNDANRSIYPTAPEQFNGLDDNCDGKIDTNIDLSKGAIAFVGEGDGRTGATVAGLGDFNGDGLHDFAIGAPYRDDDKGAVYILFGKTSGWASGNLSSSSVAVRLVGESSGGKAGSAISTAGDLNNDGFDDFAVGEPYGTGTRPPYNSNAGHLYLFYGTAGGLGPGPLSSSNAYTEGLVSGVLLGYAVGGGGDINADGYPDLALGGPWPSTTATGYLMMILGASEKYSGYIDSQLIFSITGSTKDALGSAVAIVGQADDERGDDIIVAGFGSTTTPIPGYTNAGVVYYVPGSEDYNNAQDLDIPDVADGEWRGQDNNDKIGNYLSTAGDINGDGYADFLIGREEDGGAEAYMVLGGTIPGDGNIQSNSDTYFDGESAACPCTVAGGGDINGDGLDDILIGLAESDANGTRSGSIYLFYGKDKDWTGTISLTSADVVFKGGAGEEAGSGIAIAGDVNGDGYDDIVIGAPFYETAEQDEIGRAYLLFGFQR